MRLGERVGERRGRLLVGGLAAPPGRLVGVALAGGASDRAGYYGLGGSTSNWMTPVWETTNFPREVARITCRRKK